MAAEARVSVPTSEPLFFENEAISMCLVLNRRAGWMRVLDYRAGSAPTKKTFVLSVVRREGIRKIFTIVEKDEIGPWTRMGLRKEATIPGFFKRTDGYLVGATVGGRDQAHIEALSSCEPRNVDRILREAKQLCRSGAPRTAVRVTQTDEASLQRMISAALRARTALTGFEPFGLDPERKYFIGRTSSDRAFAASVEERSCFGQAFIELLTAPSDEPDRRAVTTMIRHLTERFMAHEATCVFGWSPADDVSLASAWFGAGFRHSGLIAGLLPGEGTRRRDAMMWTRKGVVAEDSHDVAHSRRR